MKQRSGFTLIELLVVIAIISILAAILFPVFATAREKARQTSCASNEKQLGLAFLQYTEDYDELWPCGILDGAPGIGWGGQVYSYVKAKGVYVCPDDPTSGAAYAYNDAVSYAFNENLTGGYKTGTLSKDNAPASTVLLCEVHGMATIDLAAPDEGNSPTAPEPPSGGYGGGEPCSASVDGRDANLVNTSVYADIFNNLSLGSVNGTFNPKYATGYIAGLNSTTTYWIPTNPAGVGVHTGGANWLAADGHVKWLRPGVVSSGLTASAQTAAENTAAGGGACGTGALSSTNNVNGSATQAFTLTFSPT